MKSLVKVFVVLLSFSLIPLAFALLNAPKILPVSFDDLSSAEKISIIWNDGILASEYTDGLPELVDVNIIKFLFHPLNIKMDDLADEVRVGYEKPIHPYGAIAQVKFVASPDSPYTGLFKGVDNALLRVSITANPEGGSFAPGLALKLFRDGMPSQNVSALYKLSGQDQDYNFFANELSNVIPIEFDARSLLSTAIFARVSSRPTQISVNGFADFDQFGQAVDTPKQPWQLYFSPAEGLAFPSEAHDFRNDFLNLKKGTLIYKIYASDDEGVDYTEINEERRRGAIYIGDIITTSRFVASDYGDRLIFFKHNSMD